MPSSRAAESRRKEFLTLGALLLTLLAFFSRALFDGNLLYGWDVVHNEYYWRSWTFGSIRNGEVPLWNPYVLTGFPMFVNPSEAHFYPLNLIFTLLPAEAAIKYSAILHVCLLGAFQYLFLRSLRLGRFASWCGGTALALAGQIIAGWLFTGNIAQLHSTVWMPLVFLFVRRAWEGGGARSFSMASVALAAQFLAGSPEVFFYSNAALIFYMLFHMAKALRAEGGAARCARFIAALAGAEALGLALAAAQFVPTTAALGSMDRAGPVSVFRAALLAIPYENLLTFVAPDFFGDGVLDFYWGDVIVNLMTAYVGLAPLMCFALLGFLRRDVSARAFFWLGAFSLLMSMGGYTPLFLFFYKFVPGFDLFRFAPRWAVVFSFCCSVALAMTADRLTDRSKEPPRAFFSANGKTIKGIALGGAALCLLPFLAETGARVWSAFVNFSLFPPFKLSLIQSLYSWAEFLQYGYARALQSLSRPAVLLALWWAVLNARRRRSAPLWAFNTLFAVLLAADLFSFGKKYVMNYDASRLSWNEGLVRFLKENLDGGRVATLTPASSLPLPGTLPENYAILNKYSQADINNGMLHQTPNVAGYLGMQLARYQNVTAGLDRDGLEFDMNFIKSRRVADLTGARFYIKTGREGRNGPEVENPFSTDGVDVFSEDEPGMKEVYRDARHVVLENSQAFGRLHFLRGAFYRPRDEAHMRELFLDPAVDFAKVLYLETEAAPLRKLAEGQPEGGPPPRGWDPGEDRAEIAQYSNNRVELHVYCREDAFLLMTDAWHPGWRAYIDGVETDIFRADYLFRAVAVRKGFHRVVMRFEPRSLKAGLWTACLAMPLALGLFFSSGGRGAKKRRES